MTKNLLMACAAAVLTAPMLTACGDDGPFITVYNAQHEELIAEVAPLFEEETGIEVKLRSGSDLELANQLVQEGDASPADVFLTENSPAMSLVDNAGLFTKVDQETLDLIPPEYVPANRNWIGFMGRSTVAMYNTDALSEDEMPDSILDFADPEWADRISYSPTGADFQAIVSAVLELEGEQATREWLDGLAENGTASPTRSRRSPGSAPPRCRPTGSSTSCTGDPEVRDVVVARWGPDVAPGGTVDRGAIARRAFGAPRAVRGWSSCCGRASAPAWPRGGRPSRTRTPPPTALVVETPLLFEAGLDGMYDDPLVVVADEVTRVRRAAARGHERSTSGPPAS